MFLKNTLLVFFLFTGYSSAGVEDIKNNYNRTTRIIDDYPVSGSVPTYQVNDLTDFDGSFWAPSLDLSNASGSIVNTEGMNSDTVDYVDQKTALTFSDLDELTTYDATQYIYQSAISGDYSLLETTLKCVEECFYRYITVDFSELDIRGDSNSSIATIKGHLEVLIDDVVEWEGSTFSWTTSSSNYASFESNSDTFYIEGSDSLDIEVILDITSGTSHRFATVDSSNNATQISISVSGLTE